MSIKVTFNIISRGQIRVSRMTLLSYLHMSKKQLFIVRCCSDSRATINNNLDQKITFEREYFKNVMDISSKYQACSFKGDSATFNKNSNNGLVLSLRDLAREKNCEVSNTNAILPMEHFKSYIFTLDDFIEIFYLLAIPHVESRMYCEKKKLRKFLGDKYASDPPRMVKDLNNYIILLHMMRKTVFYSSIIAYYITDLLRKKYKLLSNTQIIELYYFFHFCRVSFFKKESKFDFEKRIANKICHLTLDEIAVITYGYFRNENFPGTFLLNAISERIAEEVDNWNEVQATVFSKFIRFCGTSRNICSVKKIIKNSMQLLEKFTLITSIHLGCIGINHNVECPELIKRIIERATQDISTIRIKDIERLLLASLYSDVRLTKESDFIRLVISNLETRKDEIQKHPVSYWSLLQYLIMYEVYLEDHISFALSEHILQSMPRSKKRTKMYELLFIDISLELERPSYQGNRLSEYLRKKIAMRHAAIVNSPSKNSSYRSAQQIITMLESIYGGDNCTMKRLLPHYATYHPVVCFNQNNEPQPLDKKLEMPSGSLVKAPKDGNKWLCFLVVLSQGYLSDHTTINLVTKAKLRQFKAAGYIPTLINRYMWNNTPEEDQIIYLREVVENALKNEGKSGVVSNSS